MEKDLTAVQHGELPEPSPEVVEAYLRANEEYWRRIDDEPTKLGKWRNGTVQEATAYALRTAIAAERERNPWRMVMDDALVTAHLGVATDDPYDDLNRLLDWHHVIWLDPAVSSDAQALIDRGAAASEAELSTLRTVMIAAAEEIAAHWDAHCDAEGYGPQNLIRRLEEGIPSEYGYTAGRFAELQAELSTLRQQLAEAVRERDALRAQVDAAVPAMRDYARRNPRWESWDNGEVEGEMQDPNGVNAWLEQIDAAIAAQGGAKPPAVERELFEGE